MKNKNTRSEGNEVDDAAIAEDTKPESTDADKAANNEVAAEETTDNGVEEEIKTFHAFSLVEVLEELQKLVQKGYVLDLEHNDTYPQLYGTHYIITVTKPAKVSKLTGLKLKGRN